MKTTLRKRLFGNTYEVRKLEDEQPPALPERDYEQLAFDYIPRAYLDQSISSSTGQRSPTSKAKRRSLLKCLFGVQTK